MKKNRMMRLAAFLLVCVLLTTSVISGTYAKYVSTTTDSDSARVAKWGFGLYKKGGWNGNCKNCIVAWMELPEPYKEGAE